MSKKKSEKEGKGKKQSSKKSAVKPAAPEGVAEGTAIVEAKAAKPKARKSQAAPRKTAAKAPAITDEEIALRAYYIAERRQKMGWHGDSTGDWVEAERQLKAEAARKK